MDFLGPLYPQWAVPSLEIWEAFYFFHFSGRVRASDDVNEYCLELLNQYEQLTSSKPEAWFETWKKLVSSLPLNNFPYFL